MGIASLIKSTNLLSNDLHIVTDDELQQLHKLLVEMTNDIAGICKENFIKWSLSGGSILGSVRHKGFIPWDDDIDLFMFREDFEEFKKVFPGKYSEQYELKLPGDKDYIYHFPKINRLNTTAQSIQSNEIKENVSIDIFIIENTFDNKILRYLHGITSTFFLMVDSFLRMQKCQNNLLKYGDKDEVLCKAVKKRLLLAKFFNFLSMEKWLEISDKVFSVCQNNKSKKVVVPSGIRHFFGEIYLREKMSDVILSEFEQQKYFIPKDFDYYLNSRYGSDYMIPPTEDKKEQHIYIEFNLKQ